MCAALRTLDHLQPEKRPYPQLAAVIVRLYCSIGKNDFVTNISCWHAVKRDRCASNRAETRSSRMRKPLSTVGPKRPGGVTIRTVTRGVADASERRTLATHRRSKKRMI